MAYINKEEKKKRKVKEDLDKQLVSKGLTDEYYMNLVEDYMFLYSQKQAMQKDINERGTIVKSYNSKGIPINKKNENCDMILKTNQQMLKILEFLKITPSENVITDGDDDVL